MGDPSIRPLMNGRVDDGLTVGCVNGWRNEYEDGWVEIVDPND